MSCRLPGNKKVPTPFEWIERNKDEDDIRERIEKKVSGYIDDDEYNEREERRSSEYIKKAIEEIADEEEHLYNEICDVLYDLFTSEHPTIYRAMTIDDVDEFIDQVKKTGRSLLDGEPTGIGTSWTWNEKSAIAVWAEDAPCDVVIKARVIDLNDINIYETFDLALIFEGFDEDEIRMFNGVTVLIEGILVDEGSSGTECKRTKAEYRDLSIPAYT